MGSGTSVGVLALARKMGPSAMCWREGWWSAGRDQRARQGLLGTLLPLSCTTQGGRHDEGVLAPGAPVWPGDRG